MGSFAVCLFMLLSVPLSFSLELRHMINKFCHCRNRRRAPWNKHSLYNHKTSILPFSKFLKTDRPTDRPTDRQTDKVTYKDDYPSSKKNDLIGNFWDLVYINKNCDNKFQTHFGRARHSLCSQL